jgi:hypothetical protein
MKNTTKFPLFFYGFILIVFSLFSSSCNGHRSVKRVADAFLQAYYVSFDFDAAKSFSTVVTHDNIDTRAMMFHINPHASSQGFGSFSITDVEVRQTKAAVFYKVGDLNRRLNLSLVNGKWLVDMPETPMLNPELSLSPTRNVGGFASATSEPIRLGDVPTTSESEQN